MLVRHFNLNRKIAVLVTVPFLALAGFGSAYIYTKYQDLKISNLMQRNIELVRLTSTLITHLQRERGRSSLFIQGALNASELDKQRKETDDAVSPFKKALEASDVQSDRKAGPVQALGIVAELREAVNRVR